MNRATAVKMPKSLMYPLEVTGILVAAGAEVARHTPILRYKYWHEIQEGFEDDAETQPRLVSKEFFSTFESPLDGTIDCWNVRVGDIIADCRGSVVSISEPCAHEVQFQGMCAMCGARIDENMDYAEYDDRDRAPISMSHDTALKVSMEEARRIEEDSTARLLTERRLILVVDLDQTIIHAAVDPTIGEWMADEENPNYEALKDVQSFLLQEDVIDNVTKKQMKTMCRYYVKLRPGLQQFLEHMSKLFELHVYTMATKQYALAIGKIIDPDGRYFGDRILSRDESGSLVQKNLKRLFPVSTSMVAVIDDRGDVWNWSENLIKVVPYNFFVGIGDINSSFLPQRGGVITPTKMGADKTDDSSAIEQEKATENGSSDSANGEEIIEKTEEGIPTSDDGSPIKQLVEIAGGEYNEELLSAQSTVRSEALEAQQHDRPLAKLQKDLEEKEDTEMHIEPEKEEEDSKKNGQVHHDPHSHHHHHGLLSNWDNELDNIEAALEKVHREYYRVYDADKSSTKGEPDIKTVMQSLKNKVFDGCVFLFSGILPLGTRLDSADIVQWVRSFGAVVVADYIDSVTHVIARNAGTKKVRQASRKPGVHIVRPDWVFECFGKWARVPEKDFAIEVPEATWVDIDDDDVVNTAHSRVNNSNDAEMDADEFVRSLSDGKVDWDEVNEELKEFMGDDDEDDEDDEDNDNKEREMNGGVENGRKRDRSDDESEASKRTKLADDDDIDSYDEDEFAKEIEDGLL
ncbi:RNA polymerase II subunit A C-terminal domain phosphatase [Trichomonascus vanleenenianus]|uniref:protein serine/threonine phosphatase n=1 Tax=Trichomonascus vanleenenianus TaxID=2268995 RepID=UPI003EC97473